MKDEFKYKDLTIWDWIWAACMIRVSWFLLTFEPRGNEFWYNLVWTLYLASLFGYGMKAIKGEVEIKKEEEEKKKNEH